MPPPKLSLLGRAIMNAIEDVARAKGLTKFRVDWKRNTKRELVIAVIIDDNGTLAD